MADHCQYPLYGKQCGCTFADYFGEEYTWIRLLTGVVIVVQAAWAARAFMRLTQRPASPEPEVKRVAVRMSCARALIMVCRIPDPFGWTGRLGAVVHTVLSDLSTASAYAMVIMFATTTLNVITGHAQRGSKWLSPRWRRVLALAIAGLLLFTLATAGLKDAWRRDEATEIQYSGFALVLAVVDVVLTVAAAKFVRTSLRALRQMVGPGPGEVQVLRGKLLRIALFIAVVNLLVGLTLWFQLSSVPRFARLHGRGQVPSPRALHYQIVPTSLQILAGYLILAVYACGCTHSKPTVSVHAPSDPLIAARAELEDDPPTLGGYGTAHYMSSCELEYDASDMPSSAREWHAGPPLPPLGACGTGALKQPP